jgi:glycosyltransferase involved in cell wall biosynthesis
LVKEYQALKKAGYAVKVLYCHWADWAIKADEEMFNSGAIDRNDFVLAGGSPAQNSMQFLYSRIAFKIIRVMSFLPLAFIRNNLLARPSSLLKRKVSAQKASLCIAHYPASLPAAMRFARKNHAKIIFDAEDFHRGEASKGSDLYKNISAVEEKFLTGVNNITTASPLISAAYQEIFPEKKISTILNVFSLEQLQPVQKNAGPLRLFWFSQTIGPQRGLETVMEALALLGDCDITITLLGACSDAYKDELRRYLKKKETLQFFAPVNPAEIPEIASSHDIGLATEIPCNENRDICLTNKIFTYLISSLCIIASDTRAQEKFFHDHPDSGLIYKSNDASHLATQLEILYHNRDLLQHYKERAHELAITEMNWEKESGKFLANISSTLHGD